MSVQAQFSNNAYAGCYNEPVFGNTFASIPTTSLEYCINYCGGRASGEFLASIGGPAGNAMCNCYLPGPEGTNPTSSDTNCNAACAGATATTCGSIDYVQVYYVTKQSALTASCTTSGTTTTCKLVDTQTDVNNCGTLTYRCQGSTRTDLKAACASGQCGLACVKTDLSYNTADEKCYNLFTDLNNCGAFGKSCGAIANGQSGCSEGFCSYACQVNYGLVQPSSPATLPTCADLRIDTNNCGAVGFKCPAVDGGAAACQSSACVQTCTDVNKRAKKQSNGSYLCVDIVSSITDCGTIDKICSPATNADAVCNSGVCATACQSGFARRTASDPCIAITDVNNCGAIDKACPTTGLPLLSTADCVNQQCTFKCTAPASLNKAKTGCVDLTSDSQNCGTEGMQCTTPTNALSTACVSGACTPKCVDGYTANTAGTACFKLTTDVKNCGAVGNDCNAQTNLPLYADGSQTTCVASVCTYVCTAASGLTISLDQKTCVNIQTDVHACGTTQKDCGTSAPPNGDFPECLMGQCSYTCTDPLKYSPTASACVDLTSAKTDCGTVGYACQAVTHGEAVCASSKCSATCDSGYTLTVDAANLPICVDTTTDIAHCGGIAPSNVCQPPANAMAICASSACSFACNQGFTVSADGKSCVDLQTDANNCGTLSKVCPQPSTANSSPACAAGACTLKCNTGFGLSTRQGANICLDLLSDPANCGAVGQKCPLPVNGQASCNTGACYFLCTGGLTPTEDGQCVDTNTDVLHCGANQVQCTAPTNGGKATCASGVCQEMCPSGTLLSTTTTAQGTTSTCVNIVTDAQNCGALAKICPPVSDVANSQPACKNRVCGFECQPGFGLSLDGKTCLDLQNDKANCGAVSNVCPLGPGNEAAACVAGKCDWVCGTGLTKIDGVCYDIKSNNMHCGTDAMSAKACTATAPRIPLCDAGVCSFTCITPYIKSADGLTCVNPLKDVNNCGKVNNVCGSIDNADNTDIACVKGVCSYTCLPTYTLNAAATACVDLQIDNDNCGAVGSSCVPPPFATSAQCVAGKCDIVCPIGYELDSVAGMCVDIKSDINNCGALAMVCPVPDHSTATCTAGVCSFTCDSSKGFVMSADKKSCVDTQNDYRNCGSLSNDCSTSTPMLAIPQCISGKCTFQCQTGATATADGLSCKDTQTDVMNCGALGKVCAKGPANSLATCSAGVCGFSCNEFYGVSTDKTRCVYLLTSFLNCGSVGNVCTPPTSGQSACNNGECEYVCQTGFGRTDKNACVDILTSIEACGTSNQRCTGPANSLSTCDAGVCAWACAAGFSKSADGMSCIATSSDIANCGALGQQCTLENSGYVGLGVSASNGSIASNSTVGASAGATIVANPVCMNSTCSFGCVAPLVKSTASKTCVDVSSDLNNCGALGAVCSAAVHNSIATCSSGKCGWTCPTGYVADDKTMTCADLLSDNQHCGSVGNVCQAPLNGTATCQGGKCGSACNTGFSLTSGGLCAPATMPSQSMSSGVSASSTMASVSSASSAPISASATSSAISSASMSTEQSMSQSASVSYSMSESAVSMQSSAISSSASSAPPLVSVSASISASVGLSTPSDSASKSMTPSASSDSAPVSSSASSSMQASSSSDMPSMSASSTMSSSSPSPSASLVNVASYTSNGITYTYGGCMVDSAARILSDALSYSASGGMTVEACLAAAASKGYMYAGVEYGSECYGSNTKPMAAALGDLACNMPCPGNSQQACGAGYALSLYVGSGVATKPAASNLATFSSSDVTWKYTSCWGEPGAGRALSNKIIDGGATIEACLNAATQKGYTHAGLEYGGECWAASTVYGGQIPESYCDMACSANSAQMCGSGNVLSLYSASGVSASASASSATTKTINGVAWKYQSCWGEPGEGRALDTPFDINANPTVEACLTAGSGFRYCGLEYGGECYCSNTAPWGGAIPESYCSMACKGNASEKCGAGNVLSLWVKA